MDNLELQKLITDINTLVCELDIKNIDNIVKLAKLAILSKELNNIKLLQNSFLSCNGHTSERIDKTYNEILNKINKV